MSKAFALAGARLGYLAADPAVIDALQIVRLPYHLSALTQAVARAALAHAGELLATVAALQAERDAAGRAGCARIGLTVADSDANFVLFGRFADRRAVWQGLLDRGVLVRETGPPGWLRVTIGTPAEMAAFRGALERGARPASAGMREGAAVRRTRADRADHQGNPGPGRARPRRHRRHRRRRPACRSSTTCSPSSASTAAST